VILFFFACATDDDFPMPDFGGDSGTADLGPIALTAAGPKAAVDECEEACFHVAATRGGLAQRGVSVDVWMGDTVIAADLVTREDGTADACVAGLPVGQYGVTALAEYGELRASASTSVDIREFGWVDGFVRDDTPVTEMPWTPEFTRTSPDPVLPAGEAGTWDSIGTLLPSVARTNSGYVMWYAGTAADDYIVGAATSPDGVEWTKDPRNPLFTGDGIEGSWRRYSTNSPMIVEHDGTWYMYYTGRAEETGNLTLGLATGTDPVHLTDVATNPVFSWNDDESSWAGQAAAHPAVIYNPAGWWELWYSTGYHKIGYAYSPDGLSWSRYCKNPVFEGDPENLDWETNQVKANEVILWHDWYFMTYSAGDTGAFTIGWAASRDGLHWLRNPEPVFLPPEEPGTWESNSVLSAPIMPVGDELWMWYSGTGMTGSAIGLATASMDDAP